MKVKIIRQFDKGAGFILSFPTIERNNRKSQKFKFTGCNEFGFEHTYTLTFLEILK